MKKTLSILLFMVPAFVVNCAPPAPDVTDIRPLAKDFLVALSRHDTASVLARVSDGFLVGIGGEPALAEMMDRYQAYLVPNLFEFDSPLPDGNTYRTRAYLHDGIRTMLPVDIWVVASGSSWKIDRITWYEPVTER